MRITTRRANAPKPVWVYGKMIMSKVVSYTGNNFGQREVYNNQPVLCLCYCGKPLPRNKIDAHWYSHLDTV